VLLPEEAGMRFESSVLALTWIPSEAAEGMLKVPFDLGVAHYDAPPPDVVTDPGPLVEADRVRLANELRAWAEVEDGRIVDAGYSGRGHLNVSTVRLAGKDIRFAAVALPDLQREPERDGDSVTFVQTAGGHTGAPLPRRVNRKPFIQFTAPLAWTTLTLTIDKDGAARSDLVGASPFPRHWIYDETGRLVRKTSTINFDDWYRGSFGKNTPWGETDSPALVTDTETALERQLSLQIMRAGKRPRLERLAAGEMLTRQGDAGEAVFLLLDGVLQVEVDGDRLAEIGAGAILGERAVLERGRRTATLRAITPCRVAVAIAEELDREALAWVSKGHRREEQRRG